ncbi:H-NS histone family protein [Methylovulum psychrotolerans]|uniref:Histidine biosynthesis protein n=1 Tax=Methylovulum psychrotolerans TaxID=1704499 RepID=A0A1Z4C2R9_9GAMM|nr:H-NS histone family protein [Methylovulum psychrotolerans]ASF47836.1 histidine biosynthesis protein [Methylovulum psychrotolerans]
MSEFELNKITVEELVNRPLKDLLAFQEKLNKAVENRKEKDKREVYDKIQSLALEAGFSLADLLTHVPSEKNLKKATAKVKYRNPDNKDEGWTGKGRKPAWLITQLGAGRKLEEFAV